MTLRCKDGDIAVITWDYPECLENIGRLVQVRGPVTNDPDGQPSWLIKTVTSELYSFRERDGSIAQEHLDWCSRIEHPDAWMLPISPEQEPDGVADAQQTPNHLANGEPQHEQP